MPPSPVKNGQSLSRHDRSGKRPVRPLGAIGLCLVAVAVLLIGACGGEDAESDYRASAVQPVVIDERNDFVYSALAAAGIEKALVDVTDDRTIVDYELPIDLEKEVALFYVLGAAARYTNSESSITTTVFKDSKVSEESTVTTKHLLAFLNEEISLQECQERIVRTAPPSRRIGTHLFWSARPANAQSAEDIELAEALRCWNRYLTSKDFCESGDLVDPQKNKESCLFFAKRQLLICIGVTQAAQYKYLFHADRVDKEFDTWETLVNPRAVARLAPAVGKTGKVIVVGLPGAPAEMAGELVLEGIKQGLTAPLNPPPTPTPEPLSLQADKPVHTVQVVIDTSEAARGPIEGQPQATYMREYRPERHSLTAGVYFNLTPVGEPDAYMGLRLSDGPSRDVMVSGFNKAGLAAQNLTRSYGIWNQALADEEFATGLSTPVPTAVPTPVPTPTPGPTATPNPTATPVPPCQLT